MDSNWLDSLDEESKEKAESIIEKSEEIGNAIDDLTVAYYEVEENKPFLAKKRFIQSLKESIDFFEANPDDYIEKLLKQGTKDIKEIVSRMVGVGVSPNDILKLMKIYTHQGMQDVLFRLEDPDSDNLDPESFPCWSLQELDEEGELTGRTISGLQQLL